MRGVYNMRYYSTFPSAIPLLWAGYSRVTRPSATFLHKIHSEEIFSWILVRLACVRHAASVRPEPGSNSHFKKFEMTSFRLFKIFVSNLLLANWLRFLFGFLHPHTFSETLFSFQSTTSVRFNQTAFIFYQALKLLSRTFLNLFFVIRSSYSSLAWQHLNILPASSPLCKYFFHFIDFSFAQASYSSCAASLETTLLIYNTCKTNASIFLINNLSRLKTRLQ